MITYAIITEDYKCVDIITIENKNTLDGYVLPNGSVNLIPSTKWNNEGGIGLYFYGLTNTFQSEPIVIEEPIMDQNNIPQ